MEVILGDFRSILYSQEVTGFLVCKNPRFNVIILVNFGCFTLNFEKFTSHRNIFDQLDGSEIHVYYDIIISKLDLGMEHVRKIMEIMDDEMFPTKREWVYVKICNELKQIHLQLQELMRLKVIHAPGRLDPSAQVDTRSSARIDPSAPPYMNFTSQEES
jgi:hypothetical protein